MTLRPGILRVLGLTLLILVLGVSVLTGCRRQPEDPQTRYAAAKALFEQTTKELHLPSATATGAERQRLQTEAARAYQRLLKRYPDQDYWCAEARCSLGNLHASQGKTNAALECWSQVVSKHPRQEWEVLMALKSSGDLLWEANRQAEAKAIYQEIVTRFDQTNAPPIVRSIVRGSKLKLTNGGTGADRSVEKKLAEYVAVRLSTDLTKLSEKEKQMIPILIAVADIMKWSRGVAR
jgi:tetratricopeptide (TPR) repeat protein